MKSTGIVRRIDNLGRIVIPKEVRKSLRILENDMIEIYTDGDQIILKKFSSLLTVSNNIQSIIDIINSTYKCDIFVTDDINVIAYSGINKKKYINKEISQFLIECFKNKKQIIENNQIDFYIANNEVAVKTNYLIFPIINFGNIYGLLVILNYKNENIMNEIGNIIVKIIGTQTEFI